MEEDHSTSSLIKQTNKQQSRNYTVIIKYNINNAHRLKLTLTSVGMLTENSKYKYVILCAFFWEPKGCATVVRKKEGQ